MLGFSLAKPEYLCASDIAALFKVYCSVCDNLRRSYGEWAGVFVNYDARFIALLTIAQKATSLETTRIKCPASAFTVKNEVICDDTLTFASAMTMILLEQKLLDHAHDQRSLISKYLSSAAGMINAKYTLPPLNTMLFPVDKLEIIRSAQIKIESSVGSSIRDYLEPTAEIIGEIFSHTAILSNAFPNREKLRTIGRSVGRIVCLIDACEDLVNDRKGSRFNPILSSFTIGPREYIPLASLAKICAIFVHQFFTINSIFPSVEFVSYANIIENILTRGLPERATDALNKLWIQNHWIGELPTQLDNQLSTQKCKKCNIDHLPSPYERKRSPSLWAVSASMLEVESSYEELGFQSVDSCFLASVLPTFTNKHYQSSLYKSHGKNIRNYV